MNATRHPPVAVFRCDSGAGYKYHDLLTYLLTYLSYLFDYGQKLM